MMFESLKRNDDGSFVIDGVEVKSGTKHQEILDHIEASNQPDPASLAKLAEIESKLIGVEFEGVMCSATKEDQWGLSSVKPYVVAGQSINFEFENGTKLQLTPENIAAFELVWFPFRLSFFQG